MKFYLSPKLKGDVPPLSVFDQCLEEQAMKKPRKKRHLKLRRLQGHYPLGIINYGFRLESAL